ncbi:MAG: DnaJ domain-containing protein [Chthoniobacterales bacterium]|jgi:curved DNA-binding protein CbpA
MASDHFAVLGQPRRPWLDPEQLKQDYQRLTFALHPDRQSEPPADGSDFGAVTDAYRVLSNPKLRLQHLLALENEASDSQSGRVSTELAETFMQTAALIASVDDVLKRKQQAITTLASSLLMPEISKVKERVDSQVEALQHARANCMDELKRLDQRWENDSDKRAEARKLADRFGFLDRWIAQLREKQFALSN